MCVCVCVCLENSVMSSLLHGGHVAVALCDAKRAM